MIQDQDNNYYYAEFRYRLENIERHFKEREEELRRHIDYLKSRIDYQETIIENPEELLRRISIDDIEKYLRKIKLQNLKQDE